jgi:DNA-binding LytR/AlgR family response regulator
MMWGDVIFDVIILDIELKNMSGMNLARLLRSKGENVMIIFTTSHSSYSVEGYEVNPLNYLLKPVEVVKLNKTLDKARIIYTSKSGGLVINEEGSLKTVSSDTIHYISMHSHYAKVHTVDKVFEVRATIAMLTRDLPEYFVKCNRSFLVNTYKVNRIFNSHLIMNDDTTIPISRSQIKNVRESYMRFRAE